MNLKGARAGKVSTLNKVRVYLIHIVPTKLLQQVPLASLYNHTYICNHVEFLNSNPTRNMSDFASSDAAMRYKLSSLSANLLISLCIWWDIWSQTIGLRIYCAKFQAWDKSQSQ